MSDSAGAFSFGEIEPGAYVLSAEKTGFVRQNYGSSAAGKGAVVFRLNAGAEIKNLSFKLLPQGIIGGRIVDENGEPMEKFRVHVLQVFYSIGRKKYLGRATASSGPDGTFLVGGLAPGSYYLQVSPAPVASGIAPLRGQSAPEESHVTTFFPSASDLGGASPIQVTAGAEIRGLEVRPIKMRVFRIRGKAVEDGRDSLEGNVSLRLIPADYSIIDTIGVHSKYATVQGGRFEFSYVTPASYVIESNVGPGTRLVTKTPVTVTERGGDVDNLLVTLRTAPDIHATVDLEGEDQKKAKSQGESPGLNQQLQKLSVVMMSAQGFPHVPVVERKNQREFLFRPMMPAPYRIHVSGLDSDVYVKTLNYNGQDVTRSILDCTAGTGGTLRIVLAPDAANLTVAVHSSDGAPLPGALVTLWQPDKPMPASFDPARTAFTDQNGVTRIDSLAPGEYRVIAWEEMDHDFVQDLSLLSRFERYATKLELKERAVENVRLKPLEKETIDSEIARIR